MKKCVYILVFIFVVISFSSCSSEEKITYEIQRNGDWGADLGYSGDDEKYYNQEYLNISDLNGKINDYNISLEKYFYDAVTGNIAYSICLSKQNGEVTHEDLETIQDAYDCGNISVSLGRTSFMNQCSLKQLGGKVYLYECQQVSLIEKGKNYYGFSDSEIRSIHFQWDEKSVDLTLPLYHLNEETVEFDVSSLEKGSFCICSNQGLCIVWNLRKIIKDFKQEMEREKKEKGKEFDIEDYNYDVYEEIVFVYRDGEKKIVGLDIPIADRINDNRDEEKQGNTRIRFADKLDLDNVEAIIIDGKECKRK